MNFWYRVCLFLFLAAIPCALAARISANSDFYPNYLYMGARDLSSHLMAHDGKVHPKKLVFLGSSAVSGNNVPAESTVADHFNRAGTDFFAYNLGALGANLLDSLVYLSMAAEYGPSVTILGLNPDSFSQQIESPLVLRHYRRLGNILPPSVESELHRMSRRSPLLELSFLPLQYLPTRAQIGMAEKIEHLSEKIYPHTFERDIGFRKISEFESILSPVNSTWELLGAVVKYHKQHGIKLFVYLEPTLESDDPKKHEFLEKYLTRVRAELDKLRVHYFDYTYLIPGTPEYFFDVIHMKPRGNQIIAERLARDIGEALD